VTKWIIAYCVIALLYGWWSDALDRRLGVMPDAGQSWTLTTVTAIFWPFFLPVTMVILTTKNGGGRYRLLSDKPPPPTQG